MRPSSQNISVDPNTAVFGPYSRGKEKNSEKDKSRTSEKCSRTRHTKPLYMKLPETKKFLIYFASFTGFSFLFGMP